MCTLFQDKLLNKHKNITMKHVFLMLLTAVFGLGATATPRLSAAMLNDNAAVTRIHDDKQPRLTPKQATDNLVKELGLNGKQAKRLLKLNKQYAALIANPRFKGRPQPADTSKAIDLDARTGASPKADKANVNEHNEGKDAQQHAPNAKANHHADISAEDVKAHIRQQHQKRNAYNAELQKILTPEQYKLYLGK